MALLDWLSPAEWGRRALQSFREGRSTVGIEYLVGSDLDTLAEIASADISRLPLAHQSMVSAGIGVEPLWQELAAEYDHGVRPSEIYFDRFDSLQQYLDLYPSARESGLAQRLPGVRAIRIVEKPEMLRRLSGKDPVASRLLRTRGTARHVAISALIDGGCDEKPFFYEVFLLGPIWGLLLSIRNLGDRPLRILELHNKVCGGQDGLAWSQLTRDGESQTLPLPPAELQSGERIALPLGTVIPILPDGLIRAHLDPGEHLEGGRHQQQGTATVPPSTFRWITLGPAVSPQSIKYRSGGGLPHRLSVRPIDKSLPRVIRRAWAGGSCPHLFEGRAEHLTYIGELFARTPGVLAVEHHAISPGTTRLVIAELEPEVTEVIEVLVDGRRVAGATTLRQGDVVEIPIGPSDRMCSIKGRYLPSGTVPMSRFKRIEIVTGFLALNDRPQKRHRASS